jgi:S-adenosylmethionine synthetase
VSTGFFDSPNFLFTSESVTEGHPDKLCDQVSDAVLDALLATDPRSRVACETATTTGLVMVLGEITTEAYVDLDAVVRGTLADAGYTNAEFGIDYETCAVVTSLKEQSPDIKEAVDASLEVRSDGTAHDEVESLGAGDQGMMIGFACRETDELMPLPISLAHALAKRLSVARKTGLVPYLRPDGKTQVSVEYEYGRPVRVATIVVSTQHDDGIALEQIRHDVIQHIIEPVVPHEYLDNTTFLVNPSGRFVIGGPKGDAGLTGRKIIVDTYGGMAGHGGGAFSGKDATKVDRSGAYAARWVAKNLVSSGLVDRVELQIAYAIGKAEPVSVGIDTFGTHHVDPLRLRELALDVFDLRPGAIIRDLDLRRPVFKRTASYGHFGANAADLPWEQPTRAGDLARAAGAGRPSVMTAGA